MEVFEIVRPIWIEPRLEGKQPLFDGSIGPQIGQVHYHHNTRATKEQAEANAHLLAAAPDLKREVERLMAVTRLNGQTIDRQYEDIRELAKALQSVKQADTLEEAKAIAAAALEWVENDV